MTDRDPNEGSTDPMVAEYWVLGEAVQDKLIASGYESETVEGIAVDIHDILQAADRIRETLAPAILGSETRPDIQTRMAELKDELNHIQWHCMNAQSYLAIAGK